jgi:PBP1b-binding outer membrane lipoprotein LpoB
MKKLICILASAALLGACEQKTETVAPAAPAEKKTENNTTVVNPPANGEKPKEKATTERDVTNTLSTVSTPATSTETKTDTTTTASPNP